MWDALTIISGGQTGVDQGALHAAKAAGFVTGGWAPKGWLTEYGPRQGELEAFGLVECPEPGYPARTRWNVKDADALLWIGNDQSPGGRLTISCACNHNLRWTAIHKTAIHKLDDGPFVAKVIQEMLPNGGTLLIAGNRESSSIGIQERTRAAVYEALLHLAREG